MNEIRRGSNLPRDHPGKTFYRIQHRDDGNVDIWLAPEASILFCPGETPKRQVTVILVEGINPWWKTEDELEEHIRRNYNAWCESGKRIEI